MTPPSTPDPGPSGLSQFGPADPGPSRPRPSQPGPDDHDPRFDERFVRRHVGPDAGAVAAMLATVGHDSLDALVAAAVPAAIRTARPLDLPPALTEAEAQARLRELAAANTVRTPMIGQGYVGTFTPAVIRRNVLENPAWYTSYTPYQAEISQGRLEALLTFQTVVEDLTGLPVANASLLDEASAVAEAVALMRRAARAGDDGVVVLDADLYPASLAVAATRAAAVGARLVVADLTDPAGWPQLDGPLVGVVVQQFGASGRALDLAPVVAAAHERGALVTVATDLLGLTLFAEPGAAGADVAVGSAQRFGVPLFGGGPHAAFMAVRAGLERTLPGRLVGVSVDADGAPAYRLALATREQHIRREKATSNICTAQALLAVVAGMYAVYHGPDGLRAIAERVHETARRLATVLRRGGVTVEHDAFFDTVRVHVPGRAHRVLAAAAERGVDLYAPDGDHVQVTCDETTTTQAVGQVLRAFVDTGLLAGWFDYGDTVQVAPGAGGRARPDATIEPLPAALGRRTGYLAHPVFHEHRSETAMLRYLRSLADKDLALDRTMIPLGSCTMKLNAAVQLEPISWPGFADVHPYAPADTQAGYAALAGDLETWLAEITGYDAVSLQPNAGSQGELAGLLAIRGYHRSRGEHARDVCLIPASAHGTNAASAAMAGLRVVVVATAADGSIDVDDLRSRLGEHDGRVAAIMLTYPSTHGVYEPGVLDVTAAVHAAGGQVYIDGANLNALVGLARPRELGGDVSHLNLHKTFCIPHGGGGPGVGPVACAAHLAPYLPGDPTPTGASAAAGPDATASGSPLDDNAGGSPQDGTAARSPHDDATVSRPPRPGATASGPDRPACTTGPVAGARWGSAGILPIPWAYVALMGGSGLTRATQVAVLAANYLATRLRDAYPVLYTGPGGLVAHECILDLRELTKATGVTAEDVAKRLADYGFHAPTLAFPVAGTLMVEPTESEDLAELDRFVEAMLAIRAEVDEVATGTWPLADSPLRQAPHTAASVVADHWPHPYSRERAAFGVPGLRTGKYWPPVRRIDGARGDRQLVCACPPIEAYAERTHP